MNELYLYHKKNKIKQKDMAKQLNISQRAYSSKLRGVNEFTLTESVQVAEIIGIESADKLYKMLRNWIDR